MAARLVDAGTALAAIAIFVVSASGWAAESKSDSMRKRLPAAVAKALDDNFPGAEIDTLELEKEGGISVYGIELKAGRGEIEVAEDGTVLDVATFVDLKEVPEAAASVIRKAARGGAIREVQKSEVLARIDKTGGKGRLSPLPAPEYEYEAELAKGGEIEVAADGRIIKGPK